MAAPNNNDERYYVEYTNEPLDIYETDNTQQQFDISNRVDDAISDATDAVTDAVNELSTLAMKKCGLHIETSCGGTASRAGEKIC